MRQTAHIIDEIRHRVEDQDEITLLDLVAAVGDVTKDEDELVATVTYLISSGKITLVGNFKGADVRILRR